MAKALSPSMNELLQVVRESEDAAAVRAAIMQLGYETHDEVYPLLVEKLDDPNPSIQHAAVVALGRHARAEAIDELSKPKIFHSSYHQIRWAAVTAVGRLGDYRVIDLLLKAAEDPEWIVRTEAITELMGKVKDIIARKDVRLARILIYMFSLDNEEIVNLATEGFQELGLPCLEWLHEALRNPLPNIRSNAARTLGKMKSQGSTPYLIELLQDEEAGVRASASEALGLVGNKVSIEPLVMMVQDNVEQVQDQAVTALVRFGPIVTRHLLTTLSFNTSNIDSLKKDACDREHPELQLRAIKAIGGLEDHRAVALLKELVEEGLPDIQEAASQALSQIGCSAWGRCFALKVLGEVGDMSLVPEILPSLRDHSGNVRYEAVRALGKLGGAEAVHHLVRMARKDPCDFIRREAVRLLRTAGQGHAGVLDMARQRLKDPSRDVRVQCARLLGGFQDKKSILPLLKAMADPHWSVRESAKMALLNFGRDAVELLIGVLKSASWTTRFRAARLLGEIGDPEAVTPLENALARRGERKNVREIIESSLRRLKK